MGIQLQRVLFPDGRKVEFIYTLESFYGGKWHKSRGEHVFPDALPFDCNLTEPYTKKIFRIKSCDYVFVSRYGYENRFFQYNHAHQGVKVSAENVQQLHDIFTLAGRLDLITVLLRYLGTAPVDHEGVQRYAL